MYKLNLISPFQMNIELKKALKNQLSQIKTIHIYIEIYIIQLKSEAYCWLTEIKSGKHLNPEITLIQSL